MSAFDDDRKSNSKSPIDESFREIKLLNYSRPLTAKKSEKDPLRTQKKIYTRANPTPKPKRVNTKDRFTPILGKIKTGTLHIDKEKLYQENLSLKAKLNDQRTMLIKCKSKISQLEKELQKKDEGNQGSNPNISLIKLLKQSIKDLRVVIESKNSEIEKMRKNIKLSKFYEQELETKAYMDECTRLKHLLEEALSDSSSDFQERKTFEQEEVKTLNLLKIIEENNKEIQKLKEKLKSESLAKTSKTPKFQEEFSKVAKDLESLKKTFIKKEKKFTQELEISKKLVKDLEKELSINKVKLDESDTLIQNLYKELKSLRQKKKSKLTPPLFLQVIHKILEIESKPIESYLSTLIRHKAEFILTSDFLASIQVYEPTFEKQSIDAVISYIKSETNEKISVQKLTDYYESFDFSLFASDKKEQKVNNLFKHLNLRMQLHRIKKENLLEALNGTGNSSLKEVNEQEIQYLFTNSPFDFTRKQANMLVAFLLNNEKKVEYNKFIDKFYSLIQDWEIFTSSDEQKFDRVLLTFVYENKSQFEEFCAGIDKESSGIITIDKFFEFISAHKISLEDRLKDYLVVLFYSHNMELNSVPYRQFIQAYTPQDDTNEDTKTGLVQKYMEKIANELLASGKTVREIFPFDKTGLVMADDFILGIKNIGIEDLSYEHSAILLEALQYEAEPRVNCVYIEELEDILETYGVVDKNRFEMSDVFSDGEMLEGPTEGHVQKISLLDAAQLDLMPTPEPTE